MTARGGSQIGAEDAGVSDGDAWVEARAAGFEFGVAKVGPTEATVDLLGKRRPVMANLPARDIESVEVIKGAAAVTRYGIAGLNGVITIRTKSGNGLIAADAGALPALSALETPNKATARRSFGGPCVRSCDRLFGVGVHERAGQMRRR